MILDQIRLRESPASCASLGISDMSIGQWHFFCMLRPKTSTSWGKLAPTGRDGRQVFATLIASKKLHLKMCLVNHPCDSVPCFYPWYHNVQNSVDIWLHQQWVFYISIFFQNQVKSVDAEFKHQQKQNWETQNIERSPLPPLIFLIFAYSQILIVKASKMDGIHRTRPELDISLGGGWILKTSASFCCCCHFRGQYRYLDRVKRNMPASSPPFHIPRIFESAATEVVVEQYFSLKAFLQSSSLAFSAFGWRLWRVCSFCSYRRSVYDQHWPRSEIR